MSWSAAEWALFTFGALLYSYWLYQMAIAVNGLRWPRPLPAALKTRRFVVLVPAHNEERVIGHLLDSLNAQRYRRESFDICVSCDSCTDRTVAIAREKSAIVLERSKREIGGKTANLAWALGQIDLSKYDAVAVFDADNVVDSHFLVAMNDYLEAHPETDAVQGWLDVKNPDDSWVTRVYALAFWYANRFWQLARENIGLSVNLGGTGQVLTVATLRQVGWNLTSLADDLELTCRIVAAGGRVGYNPRAVAFDEKPVSERSARAQRARWLRGHYAAFLAYGPALFYQRRLGLRALDLALHLLIPGRSAMSYATMFGGLVILGLRTAIRPDWLATDQLRWIWFLFAASAVGQCVLVLVVAPSLRQGRLTLRHLPELFAYLWYGIRWMPSVLSSIASARRAGAWSRTEHVRAIQIGEVRGPSRDL